MEKQSSYLLLLLALFSFFGAIVYKLYALNTLGIFLAIVFSLTSLLFIIAYFGNSIKKNKPKIDKKNKTGFYFFLLLLLSQATAFFILFKSTTQEAIISPWSVVPWYFFLFFFASIVFLFLLSASKSVFFKISFILELFLFNSIALIVYRLGYGYDFFVHQTTMDLIKKIGSVEPKPFYYLGEYSLLIILNKITLLPLLSLHKLLVPLLASFFIPLELLQSMKNLFPRQRIIHLSLSTLFVFPLSAFFSTTPQNMAWLWLVLVIIRGLNCKNYFDLILMFTLSLAALATQAIAGIPALFFSLLILVFHSDLGSIKKHLEGLLFFLSSFSLPLAFIIANKSFSFQTDALQTSAEQKINNAGIAKSIMLQFPKQENVFLNFIYFFSFNATFLLIAFIFAGLLIYYRHKKALKIFRPFLLMSTSLLISYFIVSNLSFDYLIAYERSAFSKRILLSSLLFFLPFFLSVFYSLFSALEKKNNYIISLFLFFFALLSSASLYLTYPRLDNYHNSHGYSIGYHDLEAVRWIESDANGKDYIVLANQQTSAAALSQFGFKKYYSNAEDLNSKEKIFFYPIPTGGKLYSYYLKMVNKRPDRETVLMAMDLSSVDTAYFVLNKYWWAFDKLKKEAQQKANSSKIFGNEDVLVYKYLR